MREVKVDSSIERSQLMQDLSANTPNTVHRKLRARLHFGDGSTAQVLYDKERDDEAALWKTLQKLLQLSSDYNYMIDADHRMIITLNQNRDEINDHEDIPDPKYADEQAPKESRHGLRGHEHTPLLGLVRQPGKPLDETQRRQIMHLFDLKDNATVDDPNRKLTNRRIAELTNTHEKTIGKLKQQRRLQRCMKVQHDGHMIFTDTPPVAGKQGGYRWCRMNEEQKNFVFGLLLRTHNLLSLRLGTKS